MKYIVLLILVLSVSLVLCNEEQNSARTRVKRQSWWDSVVGFIGNLIRPNQGPTGMGTGTQTGMGPGMQTGMGTATGNSGGQVCACSQIRRKRDSKDLEPSSGSYGDDELTRIVGGAPTRQGEYPSMVMILLDGSQHCDGTIINQYYILTAAHCVHGRDDATRFSVVAGGYNMRQQEASRVTIPVAEARYHPQYNSGGKYNNDVAIMKLSTPLQFGNAIKPQCLPRWQRNIDGATALVAGWGKTSESGSSSSVLQHVIVPIINNRDCSGMMDGKYTITANMMCAGYPQGGKDSCSGDSGGPLFLDGNAGKLQVGIVSFGEGCARPNRPGVYTRVDKEMGFILENSGIPQQAGCSAYVF